MKELEKTQRLSISAVFFLLAVIIGLLTFSKPKTNFDKSPKDVFAALIKRDQILSLKDIASNKESYEFVDVRGKFEYDRGHMENARNIYIPHIISKENLRFFKDMKENGKTVVLYGKTPNDANDAYMVLLQMGFDNLKILGASSGYVQRKFVLTDTAIEKPNIDYAGFFKKKKKE